MSQADEYLLNLALKKEVNPKGWKIVQVSAAEGIPRTWRFPDGSMMTETAPKSGALIALDEVK